METTVKTISEALKLIDVKKENLRKAFEDVQSHSSSLSSSAFSLSWSDLDSHFSSIQSDLTLKFQSLISHPSASNSNTQVANSISGSKKSNLSSPVSQALTLSCSTSNAQITNSKSESKSNTQVANSILESTLAKKPNLLSPEAQASTLSIPISNTQITNSKSRIARPELRAYCERMDGKGLRMFLMDRPKEHEFIRFEIEDAFKHAPDAAKLVLEAVEEGFSKQSYSHATGNASRKNCIILLGGLAGAVNRDEIDGEIKEKAKKFAMEWKGNMRSSKNREDERTLEALGILHLLNSFGLVSCFDVEEVVDLLVLAARYRCAPDFCRELGLVDRVPDIVQKLISSGKPLIAVKLIFEFKLTDKFPPVPLLKSHIDEAKKAAKEILEKGNHSLQAQNEAIAREVGALKSVLKNIEDHNLESEYPKAPIEMQLSITAQKRDKKRPALAQASPHQPKTPQPHSQHLGQNKRSRIISDVPIMYSTAPTFQEPSSHQTTSLVQKQSEFQQHSANRISAAPVMYSTAPTFKLPSSHQTTSLVPTDPYSGQSTWPPPGIYGMAQAASALGPSSPHLYSSESQFPPPVYYPLRSSGYGGYGLPQQSQYHPSYYPQ